MTVGRRWALLALVIAAAVVAFVIADPGGSSKKQSQTTAATATAAASTPAKPAAPPAPVFTKIVVQHGKPVGGIKKLTVHQGDPVRFEVDSDVGDEIHVHGYDYHKDVPAGGSVKFDFKAKISGGFVIELEKHAEQIAELKVQP
jgi:lipoprotein-anchoring transpeptidase ErfK/SrfK